MDAGYCARRPAAADSTGRLDGRDEKEGGMDDGVDCPYKRAAGEQMSRP